MHINLKSHLIEDWSIDYNLIIKKCFYCRLIEEYILKYASSANILHDESYPGLYSANRF